MKPSYTSKETLNRAQLSAARFFDSPYGPFISRVHPNLADKLREDRDARQAEVSQRRAEAHRLVKAAKSPTDRFPGLTGQYFNRTADKRFLRRNPKTTTDSGHEEASHVAPDLTQPGTWAVVEKRPWAGEHRIRLETRPGAGVATPDNAGDRWTEMLTERGARKISESCYFMACQRGGFTTFATLTLNSAARDRIAKRGLVPIHRLDAAGFPNPPEAARAKQGPLGVQYQLDDDTPAYNVARINENWQPITVKDPDHGPLRYNPLKKGYVWSLQKEAGRFFEAANKMYTRGWQYRRAIPAGPPRAHPATQAEFSPLTGQWETVKVEGSPKRIPARRTATTEGHPVTWLQDGPYTPIKFKAEPLAYLWVAENPNRTDENGDPLPICDEHGEYDEHSTNPHIHLMMKWRVDYRHFPFWARRLEKLWGHGFAHLEKIKDPHKAGSYVAKAAGYLSKAQGKTDQGEIRGNRYAVSSRARAPGWIECERHQIGMMGWLLAEAHEKWNNKHGEKIARREFLKKRLNGGEIRAKAGKIIQILEEKRPHIRREIGKELEAVRKKIEHLPRISKYSALFKSEEQKNQFFEWAGRNGWEAKPQNSLWLEEWRRQQWQRRNRGRLRPCAEDWADWFAMADAGAIACDDGGLEDAWR